MIRDVQRLLFFPVAVAAACQLPAPAPQEPLPAEVPPTTVESAVELPTVMPIQDEQLQRKGAVTASLEVVPFRIREDQAPAEVRIVRKGFRQASEQQEQPTPLFAFAREASGALFDVYDVSSAPRYSLQPEQLLFKVRILNDHDRILHLKGTVIAFEVDGRQVAVPAEGYEDFLAGILVPRAEKEFALRGPALDVLPSSGGVVAVKLFDVVTEMDEAGETTRNDNFEWHFELGTTAQTKTGENVTKRLMLPWEKSVCNPCGGGGATGKAPCSMCKGTGWRVDKKGRREHCWGCSGSGWRAISCSACSGQGYVLVPPPPPKGAHPAADA